MYPKQNISYMNYGKPNVPNVYYIRNSHLNGPYILNKPSLYQNDQTEKSLPMSFNR